MTKIGSTFITGTTYTPGTLYIDPLTCGACGVAFGLERSFMKDRQATGHTFCCPNGDKIGYSETEVQRLERQLKAERENSARWAAQYDQAEASHRAYKGQATKLRNRTLAGECPICGQHLRDVQRHVARQHPDEQPETDQP